MQTQEKYKPKNHIRIVTAAALFDGHDVAINVIRRIMQSTGVEVIHLGHNRSASEIVQCAIQEDVQAIAVTSYQGGHMEFFKYMFDLLKKNKAEHIKLFGGGGGVILPDEIKELHEYGICRIFSPDDGREMGLQGMVNDLVQKSDFPLEKYNSIDLDNFKLNHKAIASLISSAENHYNSHKDIFDEVAGIAEKKNTPVIGITGTGGAGKSSLLDEIVFRYIECTKEKTLAIISVDPSKRKTGGALLGDRIRMNSINSPRIYMRSLATRKANMSLSAQVKDAINITKAAGFDLIILESSGIGQSGTEIVDFCDLSIYVMTPEYGAASQLEKIDMLDYADIVAINKFDKNGAADALRDVRKQYARNHQIWETDLDKLPVFGTIASQFRNDGINKLFLKLINLINQRYDQDFIDTLFQNLNSEESLVIIPPNKARYLSEITETIKNHIKHNKKQVSIANKLYNIKKVIKELSKEDLNTKELKQLYKKLDKKLTAENKRLIQSWKERKSEYSKDVFTYKVRGKDLNIKTTTLSLSHTSISKVSLPKHKAWGDILKWLFQENLPGHFPYTSGVYPFKSESEAPIRMFAGEGCPERTNKRFHYLSKGMPAVRLSTAFDSVTLYGENPDTRPDIFGKIGNSGVSVSCLDDAKKLYSGFNLIKGNTSVSMTINGPAPIMTAYFLNAAIDQQCEIYIKRNGLETSVLNRINEVYSKINMTPPSYHGILPEGNDQLGLMLLGISGDKVLEKEIYEKIKAETISKVRGTVQADILKEDQAQNTCIYSIDFSLKLMGDVQEYFIENNIYNFYSVSISGYHIAEAGANPITQLALTLANGFTYVEYYLSRGMKIDDFAPNLSFFFSNGIDPEYSVMGRVARRIWSRAMRFKYGGNRRSQKLKYHIQTSGRSLHAQEIDFNDIRTTLQALYAVFDNCNSLHTNAYDEAITTPTEESVRRAMAIQLIINQEFGLTKNQNPLQGSFIIEELTDLVEEAVFIEFERLSDRGGVLGAMETMYQRSKIQEESLYYEHLKHEGKLPIIGVNTFLSSKGSPTLIPKEIIRSELEEKELQVKTVNNLHKTWSKESDVQLKNLKEAALQNKNVFEQLMEVVKYCSIGQITKALFEVGGQYRRNM